MQGASTNPVEDNEKPPLRTKSPGRLLGSGPVGQPGFCPGGGYKYKHTQVEITFFFFFFFLII